MYHSLCSSWISSRRGTTTVRPEKAYQRAKRLQDAGGSEATYGVEGADLPAWDDDMLFSEEFVKLTKERVRNFGDVFLDRADGGH